MLTLACHHNASSHRPFRLGYVPDLLQAQALVGDSTGQLADAIDPTPLEIRRFQSGNAAIEALWGGSLDMAYVGSGPAIIAWTRSPGSIHVVSGSAADGVVLVTRTARTPEALSGTRIASPQLGNTQDVALRTWLRSVGLAVVPPGTAPGPGEVQVAPMPGPSILMLFRRGDLSAAWVPEPWGARLVHEAGGHVLVQEASLWPSGLFPSALLVASRRALTERPRLVHDILEAHVALTDRASSQPLAFGEAANRAYGTIIGRPLSRAELETALRRIRFTTDPLPAALATAARHAASLGFIPNSDIRGLVKGPEVERPAPRGTGGSGRSGAGP